MKKIIVFVLGMHRSGTSALAGALFHSGISGGKQLLEPAYDNPKGFFENKQVVSINEDILQSFGLKWDSLFNLPDNWIYDSSMHRHKGAIRHFLQTEASSEHLLYIKDPRMCYTLPLWQEVLKEFNFSCHYLVSVRHPLEVMQSLYKRNKIEAGKACALWLNHYLRAELHSRNCQRQFVELDRLLDDPDKYMESILKKLDPNLSGQPLQLKLQASKNFLSRQLKHEVATELASEFEGLKIYSRVYDNLKKLCDKPDDPNTLGEIDQDRDLFLNNLTIFLPGAEKQAYARFEFYTKENPRLAKPVHMPVFQGLDNLAIDGLSALKDLQEIRIFPCDELCHATIRNAHVQYKDGNSVGANLTDKKITLEHGEEYVISAEDFLSIFPSAEVESLRLDILYHQIGPGALVELHRMASEIKDWFYGQMDSLEKTRVEEEEKAKQAADAITVQLKETTLSLNSARELQLQLTTKLENSERTSGELRETLGRKEAVIKTMDERIASLSMASQRLATEKEQLIARIQQAESQSDQLLKQTAEFQTRLSEHESRISALLGEIAQRQKVEKDLTEEKAALQQLLRRKEDFIWELFKTAQSFEADYRQALTEIQDIKLSISYKTGRMATFPLRSMYSFGSKKPFNQTNIWLFYHFLATGVRMPLRLIRNINGKNIVTLRKALAQEHPAQIYRNFVKLLTGGPALEPVAHTTVQKSLPPLALSPQQPVVETLVPVASTVLAKETDIAADKNKTGLDPSFRRTLVYMAPYLPDYDTSSGGKRATRILEMLALDYKVYVFTLGAKPDKYIKKLESLGVKVFRGEGFDSFKLMVPHADFLVFSFFYTYFDCHNFLKLYPNAKVIVDTVDIHWVRHERSLGLWPELTADEVRKKKILEIDVYKKADVIWAVTEQDKQAVLKEVPDATVYIVSNVHGLECTEYRDAGNHNILFFGGFSHYPNIIAAKEIALNIFPAIRQQVGQAKLIIAGANAPEDIQNLGKLPGVEVLGFVEDSYVGELYRSTFLVLAPLQAGAGIKGKICEAISHMVPVATNSIGNEGIGLVNLQSGLIADDNETLVELCVNALQRKYDLKTMTLKAQQKLSGLVGPEAVKKSISQSLSFKEVSICIVTWNKQKLLQRCIESIENHTQGIRYKILVHSNGCTDGTREYLEAAARINPLIIPILSDTNDVFVIPNNRMMQYFPENDVVLLNNDTYVTEDWLKALQNAAYSSEEIGIAGAKLLYPDGILQEFGSELYGDGTGRNIGKWDDPYKEEYCTPKFSGYVSGCVFYVKRSTIDEIGVFDEDFHPCYCEDSDYCYTAWEHGIATLVTPDCVVYHDEGATSGKDTGSGFKAYQKTNFEKFLKKHGANLDAISTKIKLKNLQQLGTPQH